ncbi:GntR family transcriptional regulator [Petralouisia muris]|uniref:GntR family transcriptional regulator n=1 Tax=Petralouisia muris TaxID=3032872 RepID=A0AC61S0T1_9FIRM|nr:GntR family transcriptional regulator [Petralouisia muris]TGY98002.1 GntR family transcriptional regulator [Petralouisia muris]
MIMKLDFASSVPIYQQIRDQIVQAVADGDYLDGDRLPTIRALAGEAGINTMTVNKAYQLLKQEGYIITDRRNGAIVQCSGGRKKAVEKKVNKELELLAAEAKIAGISQEEFLEFCRKAYSG